MSLYAIGDLHLGFQSDKSMEVFGEEWTNHSDKIKRNWMDTVKENDTVVVTGDHSWGKKLEDSMKDLEFIAALPGRKILLRGNHDRFWNKTNKTEKLNELFADKLFFLQDNFYEYTDEKGGKKYALIGSKGFSTDNYCFLAADKIEKRFDNECKRMTKSYEAAKKQDTMILSCFFIIRLQICMKKRGYLQNWHRNLRLSRLFIRIFTEKKDLITV